MKMPKFLKSFVKRRIVEFDPTQMNDAEIDDLLDSILESERGRHKHVFDSDNGVETAGAVGLIGIYCSCGEVQVHEMQNRIAGEQLEEL